MYFDLSDDQVSFQEALQKTLEQECDVLKLAQIFDSESGFDQHLWQCLLDFGLAGMMIPEEFGGSGLELIDLALMMEVAGYYGCPGPLLGQVTVAAAIAMAGNAEQKAKWLPRLASGDALATFAFNEAGQGWQPEDWSLPGGAELSGQKNNVLCADLADLFLVGCQDGQLLLVERQGAIGLSELNVADRTRRLWNVNFNQAKAEPLCADICVASRVRDMILVLLAADAFGGASRALDLTVEYVRTREQFGRPIGSFQALKHQLANMAVSLEPSRGLYWYAAHAYDRVPEDAERMAAMAKAHLSDVFMQLARDAVEAHGGMGYTWEYPLQMWFKRAMFDRAVMGAPDLHRARAADLANW